MANNTWVWYEGQEGVDRRGMVSDVNGRVNLDAFDSVNLLVAKTAAADPVIDMAACTPDTDQASEASTTVGRGWFTYTTDATAAAIPPGAYLMNIVCVDGTTEYIFPLNQNPKATYSKLVVQKSLS